MYPSANQDMISNGRCWNRYNKEFEAYQKQLSSAIESAPEVSNANIVNGSSNGYFLQIDGDRDYKTTALPLDEITDRVPFEVKGWDTIDPDIDPYDNQIPGIDFGKRVMLIPAKELPDSLREIQRPFWKGISIA
jgi:hypothetical protein